MGYSTVARGFGCLGLLKQSKKHAADGRWNSAAAVHGLRCQIESVGSSEAVLPEDCTFHS